MKRRSLNLETRFFTFIREIYFGLSGGLTGILSVSEDKRP
jgi:hypothetical protein